ncbi:uncharacterized protein GGS25DRAFT_160005 [Hypoxylon fragiforme]|uniref:uncharacterized protein n=1 Tax=Hypoxylon fragiforme TaxID=63214 RepID=UPI0020C6BE33|nr:uncharacterized protein GGS25DRAFT_160005 [Hypoxylon fragiforme]KAI2610699.1 hypothetical protein GGS25DRAFT_160005 [Hypoxylon fragiforme]
MLPVLKLPIASIFSLATVLVDCYFYCSTENCPSHSTYAFLDLDGESRLRTFENCAEFSQGWPQPIQNANLSKCQYHFPTQRHVNHYV